MKKHIYFLFILIPMVNQTFAQGLYGEILYPHSNGGTEMSCGFTAQLNQNQPGYLMAGIKPTSFPGSYNFTIDRTDRGGAITNSAWVFQKAYQIYANITEECEFKPLPVYNCAGISVIETNGPLVSPYPLHPPLSYALAGAFNSGCFFSLLDLNGNPIFSTSFVFPQAPYNNVSKPHIIECSRLKGDYIVSGSIDNLMYAFRINALGIVIWSKFYPITGVPNDMIESPYQNQINELIIVGKTERNAAVTGIDGFIMQLDEATGNVVNFQRVDAGAAGINPLFGNQYFNAICIAKGMAVPFLQYAGFMLGGYTDPGSSNFPGHAWTYKVDTTLTLTHTHVFTPSSDSSAGEIVDIISRKRPVGPHYDYFSLIKSNVGMMVIRSDGTPNGNYQAVFRESVFTPPNRIANPCQLGFVNDLTLADAGLQIYGTDDVNSPTANYVAKSYFSGESGCSYTSTPINCHLATNFVNEVIVPFGGLTQCRNFNLIAGEDEAMNEFCGPYSSIQNAGNLRTTASIEENKAVSLQTHVFPNPVMDKAFLEFEISVKSTVVIDLYNTLGQFVHSIQNGDLEQGKHSLQLNLNEFGLKHGVYFVRCNVNGEISNQKIIYAGN